ncbi:MAG: hypothetical protein M0D55_15875 [Elusimicrobiota bacterium]|nr:MAG: hypothetical protein M0D55_15875 [Elusimicrobiota bacterium]
MRGTRALLVVATGILLAAPAARAGDCGGYFDGPLGRYEVPCPGPIHGPSDRDERRSSAAPREDRGAVSDADMGGAIADLFGVFTTPLDALWSLLESARDALKGPAPSGCGGVSRRRISRAASAS